VVKGGGPLAATIALVAVAGACAVDDRDVTARPEPIVIDTFEDGTMQPTDARFNRWASTVFNTDIGDRQYRVTSPGHDSDFALMLSWDVTDMPNGVQEYPGALIRTQALGSIDLTRYTTLSFSFRVDQGPYAPLPSINIGITCYELRTEVGIAQIVESGWQTVDLPLQSFVEPTWNFTGIKLADCLSRADEFLFGSTYNLKDGERAAATLLLDDITFR
jgi:hypothetical protein